ncbi:hypothetical protein XW59_023300 [Aquamicrobium sp. LC103]|nr:hypothetical protein XW59_023300 [Aquamicrobium sp. LC103]
MLASNPASILNHKTHQIGIPNRFHQSLKRSSDKALYANKEVAVGMAVGIATGAAIGSSTDDIGIGVGVGLALGLALERLGDLDIDTPEGRAIFLAARRRNIRLSRGHGLRSTTRTLVAGSLSRCRGG